jgi:glutamine---fructose-6-phosphate transaminase (isomerizing)
MSSPESPAPFAHWMLREIHEQPQSLTATLERYVQAGKFSEQTTPVREWLARQRQIILAASGSSRHAGLVAELSIEDYSGIAVDVEYASEYCYRSERQWQDAVVFVVSQSGETADTLAALRKAQAAGHQTLAVTNVHSSTMAREATYSFPTEAGRERAIPATKSFTAQLLVLQVIALLSAEAKQAITAEELNARLAELASLPRLIGEQLEGWEKQVKAAAQHYQGMKSFLFLGRGVHYPIAREGALKLKESAYLHAEGYPSGELKHGPNALVSEGTPLVMIATVDRASADSVLRYEKVMQLMRDMREQGANILAVANEGDAEVATLANHVLSVRPASELLLPICEVIPLQFLSYFMAINNGIDVDRPRNLVKAVVEE